MNELCIDYKSGEEWRENEAKNLFSYIELLRGKKQLIDFVDSMLSHYSHDLDELRSQRDKAKSESVRKLYEDIMFECEDLLYRLRVIRANNIQK